MRRAFGALFVIGLFVMQCDVAAQAQAGGAGQTYISPSSPPIGWAARSESDISDDGDQPIPDVVYRLQGDATSRYYYLEWSDDSSVTDEAGRLLAHWPGTPGFAARRMADHLVLYVVPGQTGRPNRYDVVALERGRARRWACAIGPGLANVMAGSNDRDDWVGALQQALVAAEPALTRDHCRPIDRGVGSKPITRPALRLAFPHVGARFREDERGLRGGWLYQGSISCSKKRWHRCWVSQYLGDGRTAFITQVANGSGRNRQVRVARIFYADSARVHEQDCRIGEDYPVAGISDVDGQGGEIFFTNGERLWSVKWRGTLPTQCGSMNG